MQNNTHNPAQQSLNKVPEVTAIFWLIKMMSTTVGETAADYLNFNLSFGLTSTSLVVAALLLVTLYYQFRTTRYTPSAYWLAVVFISIFGTLITDNLTDNLGVPLAVSSGVFSAALMIIFGAWYAREKTLSIHHVDTPSREGFYWLAVLLTFALGTAVGDWIAEGWGLGYGHAAILFGIVIGAAAMAHYFFKANAVLCFWIAYILTRPLGAALGDLLAQPTVNGGLGLGTTSISLLFLITITGLVVFLSLGSKHSDALH